MNNEKFKFIDNELTLNLPDYASIEDVWLTIDELSNLFSLNIPMIKRHIADLVASKEIDKDKSVKTIKKSYKVLNNEFIHDVEIYDFDAIIALGFKVGTKKGITFRAWANKILKDYLVKGYAFDKRKADSLNKIININNDIENKNIDKDILDLKEVIDKYTEGLDLLDDYDHQRLDKPGGNETTYRLSYPIARKIIDSLKFNESSDLFGVEKEEGKLGGIIASIYQSAYGKDLYQTVEDKAAHLLYFLIKDHPFVDGCKRIAATLFLEFLNRNKCLVDEGNLIISNNTLVAVCLLTAESRPEEMDMIINVIMHFLLNHE